MALFRLPEHGGVFMMCSLSWQTHKLLDSKDQGCQTLLHQGPFKSLIAAGLKRMKGISCILSRQFPSRFCFQFFWIQGFKTTWQINSETFKERYVSSHSNCEAGHSVNHLWSHPSAEGIICFETIQEHITYISQGKACLCFVIIGQVFLFSFLCNFITIPTTIRAGFNKEELTHFSELQNGICRTSQGNNKDTIPTKILQGCWLLEGKPSKNLQSRTKNAE